MQIPNGLIGSGFGEMGGTAPPRVPRNIPSSLGAEEGKEGNKNFV